MEEIPAFFDSRAAKHLSVPAEESKETIEEAKGKTAIAADLGLILASLCRTQIAQARFGSLQSA